MINGTPKTMYFSVDIDEDFISTPSISLNVIKEETISVSSLWLVGFLIIFHNQF